MIATQVKITISNNQGESMPFNNVLRTNVRTSTEELLSRIDQETEWVGDGWK
jgi:hypothetical protein